MNEQQLKAAEEIMQLEREGNVAMVSGEILPWNTEFLAEDALQFPPDLTMMDKPGYTKWLEEFVKNEDVSFSWEPTKAVVSQSCDLGYCYGTTLLQVIGAPDRVGKYVSIWRKLEGKWRCAIEANNFNG